MGGLSPNRSPNRSPTSPRHSQNVNKKKPGRQASYQQAVGNLSPELMEDLPDLKDPEMAKAAVKIQSVFKGFKVRQKQAAADDLPSLNDKEVQAATVKIQSAFKGFNVRKEIKKEKDAAELIQRNFRGY